MAEHLTPIDILNTRFPRVMRGYPRREVDLLMRRVATELEELLVESAAGRERLVSQERELAQYRAMEATLREALVTAQKAADETRAAAHAQAQAAVQEANTRAREIALRTQVLEADTVARIELLRQERRRLARDLRATLSAELKWLEQELEPDGCSATSTGLAVATPRGGAEEPATRSEPAGESAAASHE